MKRFAILFSGLMLICSMTGCCLHGGGGYGAGYPYGGGGCPGGACGASAGGYPSAMAPGGYQQSAFAPIAPQTAYIQQVPTF